MAFSANAIAALALSLELGVALAQTAGLAMPSEAQIREAMDKQRQPVAANAARTSDSPGKQVPAGGLQLPSDKEIRDAVAKQRRGLAEQGLLGPDGSVAARVQPVPRGTFKADIDAVPTPANAKRDDLGELVDRYNAGVNGQVPPDVAKRGDLVIFVSFSMPKDVLKELSRQALELGAVIAVRGLKDKSIEATKSAALEVNPHGAAWEVHPELFKAFKVTKVPTFVVANAKSGALDEEGCAPDATYASVTGNISAELALRTIQRRGDPDIAELAGLRLEDLRKRDAPKALR